MTRKYSAPIFFAISAAWFSLPLALANNSTLSVITSLPRHVSDADEDADKRTSRLRDIANAIDGATSDRQERAALITQANHETHFADYVFRGDCQSGPRGAKECDSGRAMGLWQIHGVVPESLTGQAELALKLWRSHLNRCRGSVPDQLAGAYSGMATGGKCSWAGATKRAATHRRIAGRL